VSVADDDHIFKVDSKFFEQGREVSRFFGNIFRIFGQTENPQLAVDELGPRPQDVGQQEGQPAVIEQPDFKLIRYILALLFNFHKSSFPQKHLQNFLGHLPLN
jgi:hypothetical protein